jgi:hypothetical protein
VGKIKLVKIGDLLSFMIIYLSVLPEIKKKFQIKLTENMKIHINCQIHFSPENCFVYEIITKKNGVASEAIINEHNKMQRDSICIANN